jgi:hypothetical protein
MRLSKDAENLARIKYGQAVTNLAREHHQKEQAAMFSTPRGGALEAAKADLYLERLEKMGDAFVECWLGSFVADGITPDDQDLKQLHEQIKTMFGGPHASLSRLPLGTHERIKGIEALTHRKLDAKALEMKLEQKGSRSTSKESSNYTMKIERNYGAVQQGHHNTQNVQINQTPEALTNRLIEIIQQSSLQPLVKSEVIGNLYQIQHLGTLDQSTTVIQEKRDRILTVDKLLSTTADVYTVAVPIINALRVMLGA